MVQNSVFLLSNREGRADPWKILKILPAGGLGVTKIFRRDATKLGAIGMMQPFDLLFADPPYGKGLGEKALISPQKGVA